MSRRRSRVWRRLERSMSPSRIFWRLGRSGERSRASQGSWGTTANPKKEGKLALLPEVGEDLRPEQLYRGLIIEGVELDVDMVKATLEVILYPPDEFLLACCDGEDLGQLLVGDLLVSYPLYLPRVRDVGTEHLIEEGR